ncbi:hypothetical protein C6I20_14235 [Aeromicrobium sp. A1-2]|uniref:glycosyltransferase family 4 protein n=1 Tax=Aeromicrobium sp. A1-2 TaxID=2107713 RepID=UPI000E5142F4|nr:glycosyltransferase family 1 protein [Aeromicrobium sp. A1-2]AXT86226.1 hypothetical protein C6I20_14235 [Aeromicrobium sp. A1-2]
MKIVVDAMCAEFGGIRTYVDQLLAAWATSFPDDEVHVLVPVGSTISPDVHVRHEVPVRRPVAAGRPLAQTAVLRRLTRAIAPDAILATMPSTTLRRTSSPLAVVVHDLRHELRPQQFSRARRVLRRISYGRSYAVADGYVAVSARTLHDLHELHPSTRQRRSAVVHHGADHVLTWPVPDRTGPAVAFAHHTNKNPDLIIEAWALIAEQATPPPLLIVGVGGAREALQADLDQRGLTDAVRLAPYLPEEEFRGVVSVADMIVFPSDFEGFGIPVVEGMSLGKPVVIGPERATLEVAGGHAVVMDGWTPQALADAVLEARQLDDVAVAAARTWGRTFTWDRAVRQTRELLQQL